MIAHYQIANRRGTGAEYWLNTDCHCGADGESSLQFDTETDAIAHVCPKKGKKADKEEPEK